MKDGQTFNAQNVVSSTGIFNTYEKLIPPSVLERHQLHKQLKKVNPSVAHACLYIGLRGSPEALQLPKNNLWIYPEKGDNDSIVDRYLKDPKKHSQWFTFPFLPPKTRVGLSDIPPKYHRYNHLAAFDLVSQWQGTQWMKRGKKYERLKATMTKRLLEVLFKQLPHLKDKIDHHELSTPLTTQNFVNYKEGEIYGIDHTPERYKQKFLKPRTPIRNFYLSGQDIVSAGIGGAMFSGVVKASAMQGKNLVKKIYHSKK
jgi:all-trans-retinol 13,14-reductase